MLRADLLVALSAAGRQEWRRHVAGAMAIEYTLIAAIIGLAVIAAMNTLGVSLGALFDLVAASFPGGAQ